jgi:bacillithiol biosynthesis cysteine-adding enzyme BshC
MKSDGLDYREIPGQNQLFVRYLYDFDRVRAWYPAGALDLDRLKERSTQVLSARSYPREALADALEKFNREVGSGAPTLAQIQKLREPATVAVVTGQQVGLFGGPALAVYKAITAVRLAGLLVEQGISAVPVFWLASDDSDFQEASSTFFLDEDGGLLKMSHAAPADPQRMVGDVPLDGLEPMLEKVAERSVGLSRDETLAGLRATYSPGRTFRHAFGAWMALVFRDHGLILHDALSTGLKRFLTGAYQTAISRREAILAALGERKADLERAGLSAQVHVDGDESLLFRLSSGRRYKIEARGARYRVRDGGAAEVTGKRLEEWIAEEPEGFGPNVLLRPILQDHLFPTVAYVGGPAEVAYFAQVNAIAPLWSAAPLVAPRAGITLVDAKAQRLLSKYKLGVKDVIGSTPEDLIRRLARDSEAGAMIGRFDKLESTIGTEVEAMATEIARMDPTVADRLGRSRRKMLYQLNRSRERFIRSHASRASDLERHVRFLHSSLYPHQGLQERVLNFNHFLALEGPGLVGRILEAVKPFCKEHQILYVSTS